MVLTKLQKTLIGVLLATFAVNIAVTPGVGLEPRPADAFAMPFVVGFAVVGLAPIVVAGLLLKWPRPAAYLAIAIAALAILLNILDFTGALTEEATPTLIRGIEILLIALNAITVWIARRLIQEQRAPEAAPALDSHPKAQ